MDHLLDPAALFTDAPGTAGGAIRREQQAALARVAPLSLRDRAVVVEIGEEGEDDYDCHPAVNSRFVLQADGWTTTEEPLP